MNQEIAVKKYTDLKVFFENKVIRNEIILNNTFLEFYETYNQQKVDSDTILDTTSKVSNIANYMNQVSSGNSKLEAILTPEMKKALENGTAKLCVSCKDGQIFPKIQYNNGKSEFISLKEIKDSPNYGNMAILANQMQIQQSLKNMQDLFTDFAEETDRQLKYLQRDNHEDRLIKAETAKLDFEEFLKEDTSDYKLLMHSINEAFPSIRVDMETNLEKLKKICECFERKKTSWGMEKMMEEEQILISYVIEDLTHLQVLYNIETYITYVRNEHKTTNDKETKMFETQKKYADVLLSCFTKENLELLSGLSDLPEDIWRNNFMPGIESLKSNMKEALLCLNNVPVNTIEE